MLLHAQRRDHRGSATSPCGHHAQPATAGMRQASALPTLGSGTTHRRTTSACPCLHLRTVARRPANVHQHHGLALRALVQTCLRRPGAKLDQPVRRSASVAGCCLARLKAACVLHVCRNRRAHAPTPVDRAADCAKTACKPLRPRTFSSAWPAASWSPALALSLLAAMAGLATAPASAGLKSRRLAAAAPARVRTLAAGAWPAGAWSAGSAGPMAM